MHIVRRLAAGVALLGGTLCDAPASAQNLVTNPGFESPLTGTWQTEGGGRAYDWTRLDVAPNPPPKVPNSGLWFVYNGVTGAPTTPISQNITLARGTYTFSFFYSVTTGGAGTRGCPGLC